MPDESEASKDANEKLTCISLETYRVGSPTYSKIHLQLHSVQMGRNLCFHCLIFVICSC